MQYKGRNHELLILENEDGNPIQSLKMPIPGGLTFLWFRKNHSMKIDGHMYQFKAEQIVCLTEFHQLEVTQLDKICLIRFNRSFYCIKDHDKEVSCKGLLFYSASELPVITIPESEIEKFEILWKMFVIEMDTSDNLQFEMLQMMLKRFIILCTRLFKSEYPISIDKTIGWDLIREFNILVETHFRKEHGVLAYANFLNKSPKTLSNYFSVKGSGTPLQIIQERVMLEARRLLRYSDKSIKEIAFEIGYDDTQTFSRAFRQKEGIAPSEFRKMQ